jgi:mercuric ion binding protein
MTKFLTHALVAAFILVLPTLAHANTVTATVDGMVCVFCAKGIEDKLMENPKVASVTIDMDKTQVVAVAKPGQTLVAEDMKKAIHYLGFTVRSMDVSKD